MTDYIYYYGLQLTIKEAEKLLRLGRFLDKKNAEYVREEIKLCKGLK